MLYKVYKNGNAFGFIMAYSQAGAKVKARKMYPHDTVRVIPTEATA